MWTGEDLKDFVWINIYTGLRISDIVFFDIGERLQGNEVLLRAKKNGGDVFTRANIKDDRATPHRFRHTFTRILLQRGVSISDVAVHGGAIGVPRI